MRRALVLVAVLLGTGPVHVNAQEDPTLLQVRARSELRLSEIGRQVQPGGRLSSVRVRVELRDSGVDVPLPGQTVSLEVRGEGGEASALPVRTDERGAAEETLTLPAGRHELSARYGGDALRDAATAAPLEVNLRRRGVLLGLSAPARAQLGGAVRLVLDLRDGQAPLSDEGSAVVLRLAGEPVPLQMRDGHGEVTVPLAGPRARGGDVLAFEAHYPGNDFYDAARARAQVLVTTQVEVTLDAPPLPEVHQGGTLALTGAARDEEGALAGEPVELLTAGPGAPERLARGETDEQGRFRLVMRRVGLPQGEVEVAAVVTPRRSYRLAGRSAPQRLRVLEPEPVSMIYYLAPLLLTGLLLGLSALGRRWPGIAAWLRRRAPVPAAAGATPAEREEARAGRQPGVTLGTRGRSGVLSLRGADVGLDGQVRDAAFGGAVPAQVVVRAGGEVLRTLACDDAGRFEAGGLPAGSIEVEVTAAGYLRETFSGVLPHRGELRGVQVALMPIRARIFEEWRRVAQPLLEAGEGAPQIATWTPRELLGHVRRRGEARALWSLVALTDLVEEAYYSGRLCTSEMLGESVALAEQVAAGWPALPEGGPILDAQKAQVAARPMP
jgi:hypothetical protein